MAVGEVMMNMFVRETATDPVKGGQPPGSV